MKDKYILITGATKGLGLELAKQLSYCGYNIILTSRNKKNLEKTKSSLNPNLSHKMIKINFEKDNIETKLLNIVVKLNIVAIIHNFGKKLKNDHHPIDLDLLQKSIYNNFLVSIKINNYFYNQLNGNPSKIIYIGSSASLHAKASPSYTLSKSLINTYVKNISAEYLKKKILICAVLPGIIKHKYSDWEKKKKENMKKYLTTKKSQPLERFATPSDIAYYIIDLIKQKSFMITGSTLKLDANDY